MHLQILFHPYGASGSDCPSSNIVRVQLLEICVKRTNHCIGQKLLHSIETNGVVIMVGQTGCGKTTRKSNHDFVKAVFGVIGRASSVSS